MSHASPRPLRVAALFAGIGGIELGLEAAGAETALLCESDAAAQFVLRARFPSVPLVGDVRNVSELPSCDVLTAGFPCQDLSQAGTTAGIGGARSGLVGEVFRLLDTALSPPRWLILENVSFMLALERGRAMRWLTEQLGRRGYTWAYRVLDTRAFGLPQRRQRVILLASKTHDPRPALLSADHGEVDVGRDGNVACGFYWTEGTRGLGWAVDAVPTIKGGSTLGIPSPPAIWQPGSGRIVTPDIRDAERLQGFPSDWTAGADGTDPRRRTSRWKLVGNAVSVPVAAWVGERLATPSSFDEAGSTEIVAGGRWPNAAWGHRHAAFGVDRSMWPVAYSRPHLHEFLEHRQHLLSARATAGFLARTRRGNLRIPEDLICEVERHLATMLGEPLPIAA